MLTVSLAAMFRLLRSSGIEPRKSSPLTPQKVKSSSALVTKSESGSSGTEAGRPGVVPDARPRNSPGRWSPRPSTNRARRDGSSARSRRDEKPGARSAIAPEQLHHRAAQPVARPQEMKGQERLARIEDQLLLLRPQLDRGGPSACSVRSSNQRYGPDREMSRSTRTPRAWPSATSSIVTGISRAALMA